MWRTRASTVFAYCIVSALYTSALAISGECAVGSSCILPVPQEAPPNLSAEENLKMIQCHLGCISKQRISIQILNQETVWPSYSFSTLPCITQQKINECTLGCMTRQKEPDLTVNRCRDECVSECERDADTEAECGSICRRTFCRYGCSMQQTFTTTQTNTIPGPIAAPLITCHTNSSSTSKLFVVNITDAMPTEENHQALKNVSYLYKIQQGNDVSYIWQNDITLPLDLSAFTCSQIEVSFAVVTMEGRSEFSPTCTLCVDGVGGWPSNVDRNSISASYTEDLRPGYLGYSVANITWETPQDHQYLTSYSIHIHTRTQNCGGLNTIHMYNNITKDATWFVIRAHELNRLMMFGCSYTLSIVSRPERPNQNRITTNLAPELTEQEPEINLECKRVWDRNGFMNISVNWSLSSSFALPAIRRFSVVPLLIDSSQLGVFGRLDEYSRHRISAQTDRTEYSVFLTDFSPQRIHHYKYKIEVRVERNNQYLWRRVPSKQTCTVNAESHPPSAMTNISTSDVKIQWLSEEQSLALQFNLMWSPPATANGILTEYELAVGTGHIEAGTTLLLHRVTFPAEQSSTTINITFLHNTSVHCLHVMMRSTNSYVWSDWNESEIIGLDSQCLSATITPLKENSVSIFVQRVGEGATRIAELSCDSSRDPMPHSISDKLYNLEQRLNEVPDVQGSTNSLAERLRSLEWKIDQVIDAVTQNNTQE